MVIGHYDRNGKQWLFKFDCTRPQAYIFANLLRILRQTNIRSRHTYNGRYTDTELANRRFCEGLEREVLTALYKTHGATDEDRRHDVFYIL